MDGVKINFNVARSLRERFGFSLGQVVEFAKISDRKERKNSPAMSAEDFLADIEAGKILPSKGVVESLASFYKVPFLAFFLPSIPSFDDRLIDFRTLESKTPDVADPVIFAIKRRVKMLQEELSDLEQETNSDKKDFVGVVKQGIAIEDFVAFARNKLGFSLVDQKALKKSDDLFKVIRNKIENIGIFVIQLGNLGSHHTNLDTKDFRGIAISDDYAPLIVINPNDSKPAQLFSLLHELAHIFLGDTSISNVGLSDFTTDNKEAICNAFAAEFLLPRNEIQTQANITNVDDLMLVAKTVGDTYRVSNMMVIRRLFDARKITKALFDTANAVILRNYKNQKERSSANKDIIVNPNVVLKSYLGEKTLTTISNAAENNLISPATAAAILGININRLSKVGV